MFYGLLKEVKEQSVKDVRSQMVLGKSSQMFKTEVKEESKQLKWDYPMSKRMTRKISKLVMSQISGD